MASSVLAVLVAAAAIAVALALGRAPGVEEFCSAHAAALDSEMPHVSASLHTLCACVFAEPVLSYEYTDVWRRAHFVPVRRGDAAASAAGFRRRSPMTYVMDESALSGLQRHCSSRQVRSSPVHYLFSTPHSGAEKLTRLLVGAGAHALQEPPSLTEMARIEVRAARPCRAASAHRAPMVDQR